MEQSDKMWGRGKDMINYVLKRGGKMGSAFQVEITDKNDLQTHAIISL